MSDINIRISGRAGRITLTRPKALNALSYDMCIKIEDALIAWRDDPKVDLVVIDAEGDRAFCAGGDIADLYDSGLRRDYAYGQKFWADEYRLNAIIATYPKPYIAFMQGFTMGGGVGISCHGSHRIVGESSQIAMPECGIGLVPDVGGSLLLSRAPSGVGAYLGITATRMQADDAIFAGFADHFIPEHNWPNLIQKLEETGETDQIMSLAQPAPHGSLRVHAADLARLCDKPTLSEVIATLRANDSDLAKSVLKSIGRNSPLAMGSALHILSKLDETATIQDALRLEYRFTARAVEHGDFIEGIRAAIIDKDRTPN
ncbi:MAG: enoyl-CoA hydratase/isomerase family protein, partial [Paracoccaceae bacterium]